MEEQDSRILIKVKCAKDVGAVVEEAMRTCKEHDVAFVRQEYLTQLGVVIVEYHGAYNAQIAETLRMLSSVEEVTDDLQRKIR